VWDPGAYAAAMPAEVRGMLRSYWNVRLVRRSYTSM
jgi:hypothetical protein